jgi:preprotein translocase subunit SecE
VQTSQLFDDEEQEEASGSRDSEEVLPVVQFAHGAQRDTLVGSIALRARRREQDCRAGAVPGTIRPVAQLVEHRSPKAGVAGSIPAGPAIQKRDVMIERIKLFLSETRTELKKVTWPTREELRESTYVVIISTFIVTIFVGVVDQILSRIIRLVFG